MASMHSPLTFHGFSQTSTACFSTSKLNTQPLLDLCSPQCSLFASETPSHKAFSVAGSLSKASLLPYSRRLFASSRRRFWAVRADLGALNSAHEMLQQLQSQMDMATAREDYADAASIRDTINLLLEKDPTLHLKALVDKAIAEERYEDAAKFRDQLEKLAPSKTNLVCHSDTTTQDIRVQVRSVYVKDRSQPFKGQYFFAYRIRISNESSRPVQLLRRHWIITDANDRTEHVRGPGVVGKQPILPPGTTFEYTSACPLGTATGKMEGDFELRYMDDLSMHTFNVIIGSFALSTTCQ